ncbi:unnamed protein product [Ectocarpus sp. 6 AP-2014]
MIRVLNKLRGVRKKEITLHFLCPVDMTQVALVTAKVAIRATSGMDVDLSDFLKDVKDGLVDKLVDRILGEDTLLKVVSCQKDIDADMQKDTRASYQALKKFMDKEQVKRLKNAKDGVWLRRLQEKNKACSGQKRGNGVGSK